MVTKGKTDKELWRSLEELDDDLLDFDLPEAVVDEQLTAIGVDPSALAIRGGAFVAKTKEDERLSWQQRAQDRRVELQARASSAARVPADMDRPAVLARLEELRTLDPNLGTAIRMAARKRKPEESTDEELRALLEEMEALRAIEGNESE